MRRLISLLVLALLSGCGSDSGDGGGSGGAAGSSGSGGAAGVGGAAGGGSGGTGGGSGGSAGLGGIGAMAGSGGQSCIGTAKPGQPYPPSCVITDMSFDWSSHDRKGAGADNWPVTWGADGHQYTSWGDGWGFQNISGTKISLGVSRIEGASVTGFTGVDVWEGDPQGSDLPNDGKSYGVLAVGSDLYMWVSPGSNAKGYAEQRLWKSSNGGQSWTKATWAFTKSDGLVNPTFAQFGKGYQGAPDGFVYIYANHIKDSSQLVVQKPGEIALLRVAKGSLMDAGAYEFFAGLDGGGKPEWVTQSDQRKPVFEDPEGVGWNTSVSFNAPLGRYLLMTEHTESLKGNLGVFEAPSPWGPWFTVAYLSGFGSPPDVPATGFFWNFSNKWLSADGKEFVLVFTGIGANDSWNTVQGTFTTP